MLFTTSGTDATRTRTPFRRNSSSKNGLASRAATCASDRRPATDTNSAIRPLEIPVSDLHGSAPPGAKMLTRGQSSTVPATSVPRSHWPSLEAKALPIGHVCRKCSWNDDIIYTVLSISADLELLSKELTPYDIYRVKSMLACDAYAVCQIMSRLVWQRKVHIHISYYSLRPTIAQ